MKIPLAISARTIDAAFKAPGEIERASVRRSGSKPTERGRIKKLRRAAFKRQSGLCFWCHDPMIEKTSVNGAEVWNHRRMCTADHLLWKARGGLTTRSNIVAACADCNQRRHPPPHEGDVQSYEDWPWLYRLVSWCRYNSVDCAEFFAFPKRSDGQKPDEIK